MIIDAKILSLWGYDLVIRARAVAPHTVLERLANEACFYYVLEGTTSIHTPKQLVEIQRNDGIALQCGNYLGTFLAEAPGRHVEIVIVKFPKEVIRKIYDIDFQSLLARRHLQAPAYQSIPHTPALKQYVDSLLFYIEHPDLAIEELLILKIKELFLLLAQTDNFVVIEDLIQRLFQEPRFNFVQTVEQHLYSHLKLEELAHLCAMSLSTFKRRFKEEFGETPRRYFTAKKMERARRQIQQTSLPLAEVAEQAGFRDYPNFSAAFKRYYGKSPSALR